MRLLCVMLWKFAQQQRAVSAAGSCSGFTALSLRFILLVSNSNICTSVFRHACLPTGALYYTFSYNFWIFFMNVLLELGIESAALHK